MTRRPSRDPHRSDGFESAKGIYVNFARSPVAIYVKYYPGTHTHRPKHSSLYFISDHSLLSHREYFVRRCAYTVRVQVPTFDDEESDQRALAIATKHADRPVIGVNASAVAIMGGSVRCLSTVLWGAAAMTLASRNATKAPPLPEAPVGGSSRCATVTGRD